MKPAKDRLVDLYCEQRLTTRQIGKILGVTKTSVRRWLIADGIELRAANNGLLNRGIEPPTPEELQRMVHVEHLSYEQIAALYGVDFTAVPYWLKKHGIERPNLWTTRRKGFVPSLPDREAFLAEYLSGESLEAIGKRYGVSKWKMSGHAKSMGVDIRPDGFDGGKRLTCNDGHVVRSVYEQRVDDWLNDHGVPHEYEPRLPFSRTLRGDFLANGWYVEIWGVTNNEKYKQQKARKIDLYAAWGLPLIGLEVQYFSRNSYQKRLVATLNAAPESGRLGLRQRCFAFL